MFLITWLLVLLLANNIRGSLLQWPSIYLDSKDCPECKQFLRKGANFSSVLLVDEKLVVGARNAIFYLNFDDQTANHFPDEAKNQPAFETCTKTLGQSENDCQNYYRVILQLRKRDIFICGTNSFKPLCSIRSLNDLSYPTYEQELINALCPASPEASFSFAKLSDMKNVGFAAISLQNDRQGKIQRVDLKYESFGVSSTTKDDTMWLNAPVFHYSFEDGEYVYILFNEIDTEKSPEKWQSRVARICKNDEGSKNVFYNGNFMTFIKTRIYCSYRKENSAPHTFDQISAAYYKDKMLYVLFTGSNTIVVTGSVLCTFPMSDIEKAFKSEYRTYKHGSWTNYPNEEPFSCKATRTISDLVEKGVTMAQAAQADSVLFYSTMELKSIVVSSITMQQKNITTVHTGSADGRVVQLAVTTNSHGAVKVTNPKISDANTSEILFLVSSEEKPGEVYSVSADAVTYHPLEQRCDLYDTCHACQDAYPNCGWCYDNTLKAGKCGRSDGCGTGSRFFGPFDQCAALPKFTKKPTNTTVHINHSISLECKTNSVVVRRWRKNPGSVPYNSTVKEDGTLFIRSASTSDEGCYTCELSGSSGSVTSRACVTVLVPPYFVALPTDNMVTVSAGDDVLLECRAEGKPRPSYTWSRGTGEELPEGAKITPEGDLKLIRVINHDAGTYRCTASNGVRAIQSDNIVLKVEGTDPESDKINGSTGFDITTIIIAVFGALVIIILIAVLVHTFIRRHKVQKGSPGYCTVPDDDRRVLRGFGGSQVIIPQNPHIPTSSLPSNFHPDPLYPTSTWAHHPSTITCATRHGSPGFPANLADYSEQPPPPYQPHILAAQLIPLSAGEHPCSHPPHPPLSPQPEHEYDEINVCLARQPPHHFGGGGGGYPHPGEILTVNGYNSTFHGQLSRVSPPVVDTPPPQLPQRSHPCPVPPSSSSRPSSSSPHHHPSPSQLSQGSYEVVRKDSPLQNTHGQSILSHPPAPPTSHSPWSQNSDI